MAADVTLPEGFVLDQPEAAAGLPPGFVLDAAPSVGEDIAKTALPSLARMATGTAGTPGDLRSLLLTGAEKLGVPAGVTGAINTAAQYLPPAFGGGPTTEQLTKGVEGLTGPLYQPQTMPGKILDTAAQLAPGVIGGPESLAAKIATRVAAPAVAAEVAGKLAEGTTAEPYVKPAAALAATALTHKLTTPAARALTAEDLKAAAQQQYADVHALGLELKAKPVEQLAYQIESKLTADGFTARNAKPVYEAIDTLKKPPAGAVVTSHNFDNLRKEMVQAAQSSDGTLRNAAGRTIGMLDDYLANIPASHVLKGDAAAASDLFKQARANWAAMKRLEMAGGKIALGELNASTAHSGQNIDNALRQAIKQLIRPDKYGKTAAAKAGFNDAEIAQMKKIARGTSVGNVVRTLGNMAGGGLGIGVPITAAAAAYHFGPAGAVLPIAGYGLRKLGNVMTSAQAAKLAAMTGARSPLGALQPAVVSPSALPPAALAALLTRRGLLPLDESAQ